MRMCNVFLSGVIILFFISCSNNDQLLKNSLAESKGNYSELKRVLLHYQNEDKDPLKEKAARFLIENMNDKYSYTGTLMDAYNEIFDTIRQNTIKIGWDGYSPVVGNYMNKVFEKYSNATLDVQMDLQTITAKQLIENIDLSFYSWDRAPWAKHYTFEQFCEYVLPYRFMNESIDNWRLQLLARNSGLLDSLRNGDVISAVSQLNKSIYVNFSNSMRIPFAMNYTQIIKTYRGRCIEQCNFALMNMRAIGIPVCLDFFPTFGRGTGHTWNAVLDTTGKTVDFLGTYSHPYKHTLLEAPAKIYRQTYSIQRNTAVYFFQDKEPIPDFFKQNNFIDVTNQYNIPTANIIVRLNKLQTERKLAYICTFREQMWMPIAYGSIKRNQVLFENMGCGLIPNQKKSKNKNEGIVYLPVIMISENNYQPINYPFILSSNKKVFKLIPNSKKKNSIILNYC